MWEKADYLNGLLPSMLIDLGDPTNITLVQPDSNHILPDTVFSEASFDPGSFTRPSYDFQFDLSAATLNGTATSCTDLMGQDYS